MAWRASKAPSTTRPAQTRRRHRPTRRMTSLRHSTTLLPQQRDTADTETLDTRPKLTWVLLPDSTGRLRPQARWI